MRVAFGLTLLKEQRRQRRVAVWLLSAYAHILFCGVQVGASGSLRRHMRARSGSVRETRMCQGAKRERAPRLACEALSTIAACIKGINTIGTLSMSISKFHVVLCYGPAALA